MKIRLSQKVAVILDFPIENGVRNSFINLILLRQKMSNSGQNRKKIVKLVVNSGIITR